MNELTAALFEAWARGDDGSEVLAAAGLEEPKATAVDLAALGRAPDLEPVFRRSVERILGGPDPVSVARGLRRVADAGALLDPQSLEIAIPLFACSADAVRFFVSAPQELGRLAHSPDLRRPRNLEGLREELAGAAQGEPALMTAMRRLRRREHARIAWRDIVDAGSQVEILGEISDVAEALLGVATEYALSRETAKLGAPRRADGQLCGFTVLGFGKLGGRELNFSSDVDVLYVYETDQGGVEGSDHNLHEFFDRVARRVNRLVGETTADGFALRVDLDLRPEGTKGPLVNSHVSLENYYEAWGQTWERSALIKARPVGGDYAAGDEALRALTPFVYRRSIDQRAVEEIRAMKARIDAGEQRRAEGWNIKLGRGGIREIEFFVQAHQLLLGGKRERLRVRGTLAGLEALAAEGVIPVPEGERLQHSYLLLRRLEHRIQMAEGRQTHRIPEALEERALLARRFGLVTNLADRTPARGAALLERLILHHRQVVMSAFDGLFHSGAGDEKRILPGALADLESLPAGSAPTEDAVAVLRSYGIRDTGAAFAGLARLARTSGSPLSSRAPERLQVLGPQLLEALRTTPDPDQALRHACDFLLRIRGRLGAYALLRENPAILKTLLDLFGTSDFLAKLVVRQPELLDPLIIGVVAPHRGREELVAALRERTSGADDEMRLNQWRKLQDEELLRIGLADVSGRMDLQEVQRELTALAEAVVEETLAWALAAARRRWSGASLGESVPLCVVGMGKLGGRELNYNSDLDLLFLFGEWEGAPSTSLSPFFAKVAQKLLFGLSCVTEEGLLYNIDARLRPSGRYGSLVSSLSGFATYHQESAQIWERLALTRARPVAGPAALRREVEEVLVGAAYERPWPEGAAQEVDRLRRRMEVEVAREGPRHYNVKAGRGGLVDVEFGVQLLQLRVGRDEPRVRRTGTLAALEQLRRVGGWDVDELDVLRDSYVFLRRLENRLRIHHDNAQSVLRRDPEALQTLARRMDFPQGGTGLLTSYEEVTGRVRSIYERIIRALS